jgi:dTDP-4-dehydrorhamnose 3,5-epimerase
MTQKIIDGVILKPLKIIPDERGRLMEILRSDDKLFEKFGQIYMTSAYPGVVKAWHYHKLQDDHFIVIRGMMKVALFDDRDGSSTKGEVNTFFLGEHNMQLLKIPKLVWHGFKCISEYEALVLNIPTMLYNYEKPDEYREPAHGGKIPYNWDRLDG